MATITKLEQKTYQGKPQGFKITFSDGRTGNLQEKESDKGLKEGEEVMVSEIPYTSKAGVSSILYGARRVTHASQPPQQTGTLAPPQPQRPAIHVGAGKSKEELKADATTLIFLELLKYLKDGKLASDKIASELIEWDRLVWAEIDEAFSNKK